MCRTVSFEHANLLLSHWSYSIFPIILTLLPRPAYLDNFLVVLQPVVRELKISDYVFFVGDKLAPILIERKSADDVANSLADGRWERQQRSMRKAQYVLGGGAARRCQICYLIEGDPSRRVVHGGNVGRVSWNQVR